MWGIIPAGRVRQGHPAVRRVPTLPAGQAGVPA